MKIGVLSPYCSQNYGTVLQAFAFSIVLQSYGVECAYIPWRFFRLSFWGKVEFLLRHPLFLYAQRKVLKNNQKDLDYKYLSKPDFQDIIRRNTKFVEKYIPVDEQTYYVDFLPDALKKYDKLIVGSDQTWCPDSLYQYSPYYLPKINVKGKKFAYACSMGTLNVDKHFKRFLKKSLRTFDLISCREDSNARMLAMTLNREVPSVLDPTLLLESNFWHQYTTPVEMPKKYILCYILGERKCIGRYAEELAIRKGLPVYYIMTRPSTCVYKNVLKGIGVSEFLWLIENCQYLITDSFHGTIFAINFHKNMIAYDKHEGEVFDNGRIEDVLTKFGIKEHYFTSEEYVEPAYIDYDKVECVLNIMRKSSMEYINKIIDY